MGLIKKLQQGDKLSKYFKYARDMKGQSIDFNNLGSEFIPGGYFEETGSSGYNPDSPYADKNYSTEKQIKNITSGNDNLRIAEAQKKYQQNPTSSEFGEVDLGDGKKAITVNRFGKPYVIGYKGKDGTTSTGIPKQRDHRNYAVFITEQDDGQGNLKRNIYNIKDMLQRPELQEQVYKATQQPRTDGKIVYVSGNDEAGYELSKEAMSQRGGSGAMSGIYNKNNMVPKDEFRRHLLNVADAKGEYVQGLSRESLNKINKQLGSVIFPGDQVKINPQMYQTGGIIKKYKSLILK